MSDEQVKKQIIAEYWRLDVLRRSASTSALEAIAEQQRPAREALHAKCEEATGHNMMIEGNTVGGLAYGRCRWCGKYWREEREVGGDA
jgi:dTDP-glucose pyrophosphorylase